MQRMSFYVATRGHWQSRPFPASSCQDARRHAWRLFNTRTVVALAA